MSNLPPCGACSYTPATETLAISISPLFVGVLSEGRLTLRSDTGAEIIHPIPYRLGAGGTAIVKGLGKPMGARVARATLAWAVVGDPAGATSTEQPIAVNQ
jgi:hypothetical protein